jgi:chromosome partitioning protein
MRTIALVNQKGGVGKSTTAVNLSAGLARLGQRVLLIDLDPQAHATVALGLEPRKLDTTVYSLLSGSARASEVIRPVSERLSLIPSNIHLAGGEAELASLSQPSFVLKQAMASLDESQFDYAIIDSPPQLGFLNVNSLAWVREVFIPVTCEFYALHGLSLLMETVERVRSRINPDLRISGVITCQVHHRRAITRDVLADLERHFPGRVLKTRIRVNVRLVEAPSHGKSIFDYAPESNGAVDYMNLAKEMVELGQAMGYGAGEAVPETASAPAELEAAPAPEAATAPEGEPLPAPVAPDAATAETPVALPPEPAPGLAEELPAAGPAAVEPAEEPVAAILPEPSIEVPSAQTPSDPPAPELAESEPVAVSDGEPEGPEPSAPEAAPEGAVSEPSPSLPAEAEAVSVAGSDSPAPETAPEPVPVESSPETSPAPAESVPPAEEAIPAQAELTSSLDESSSSIAEATSDVGAQESAPDAHPYVQMPPGVPLTTPVTAPAAPASVATPTPVPATSGTSTYAKMLGLSGLKPIVVAKPGGAAPPPVPPKEKGHFGQRLLGRLMGKKE